MLLVHWLRKNKGLLRPYLTAENNLQKGTASYSVLWEERKGSAQNFLSFWTQPSSPTEKLEQATLNHSL